MSSAITLPKLPKVLGQPCTTRNTNSLPSWPICCGEGPWASGSSAGDGPAPLSRSAMIWAAIRRQHRPAQRQHRAGIRAAGQRGELSGMSDRDAEHIVLGDHLVEEAGLSCAMRRR